MIAGSFRAMGTMVSVTTHHSDGIEPVRELFDHVERVCSRFEPTSELSVLNVSGAARASRTLSAALQAAQEMERRTDGLVTPGVGRRLIDWGYNRSFELVEGLPEIPTSAHRSGSWHLHDRDVTLNDGVLLDLGGTAKGWACDQAVESGLAVMVSAGGDLRSTDPELLARIVDPMHGEAGVVHVGVGALATSTVGKRTWKAGVTRAHHIIDPRSGDPAVTPISTASAVCATAVEAEAAAKAILMLGSEGLRWADSKSWIHGALAVWHDGSVYATTDMAVAA
ncbi:MAG: FAD:protein FMN transferase [Acidimicrobiia bacterium]|nr:FAD:protein FMN transferase [Acidimicrobiia bacterium]